MQNNNCNVPRCKRQRALGFRGLGICDHHFGAVAAIADAGGDLASESQLIRWNFPSRNQFKKTEKSNDPSTRTRQNMGTLPNRPAPIQGSLLDSSGENQGGQLAPSMGQEVDGNNGG